ncbi:MAG: hypothetical protein NTZ65_03025 [Candidatus Berkelbacteria bacterium]|nr:hypothetical protein [Candidatus Berkelbacteria bacterium]
MTDDTEKEPVAPAELPQGEDVEVVKNEESAEQPSEPVDPRKQEVQADRDRINEDTRTNLERSDKEARSLAKTMAMMKSPEEANDLLREYFKIKKDIYGFGDPQTLAKEILQIESSLMQKLIADFHAAYPKPEPNQSENINNAIESVRASLYGMVLNGTLKGEKVTELIAGGIHFLKTPGAELSGTGLIASKDIFAYTRVDKNAIYIYENFINGGRENGSADSSAQAHVIRHEFSHILVENGCVWDIAKYNQFLDALESGNINGITDPDLLMIAIFLTDPSSNAMWNHDIKSRLGKLHSLPSNKQQKARVGLAQEIAAEVVGCFLEGSVSPETFLEQRFQFLDPKERIGYLIKLSGKSESEFADYYGITAQTKPSEIIGALSKYPEFKSIFKANTLWFNKFKQAFSDRGKDMVAKPRHAKALVQKESVENQEIEDFGFSEDDLEMLSVPESFSTPTSSDSSSPQGSSSNSNSTPFVLSLWESMTGQKSM